MGPVGSGVWASTSFQMFALTVGEKMKCPCLGGEIPGGNMSEGEMSGGGRPTLVTSRALDRRDYCIFSGRATRPANIYTAISAPRPRSQGTLSDTRYSSEL